MASSRSYSEITILLVDDDSICLSILTKVLERLNYHVVAFKSPLDALHTLHMGKRSIDLVLTDVHMPEMSGLELLKIVDKEFKLPVVLMSNDKTVDTMMKGLEDGAAFYLVKPISTNYLSRLWQYAISLDLTDQSINTSNNSTQAFSEIDLSPTITKPLSALTIHDKQPPLQLNNNNDNDNFKSQSSGRIRPPTQLFFSNNNPLKRPNNTDDLGNGDCSNNKKKPKLVWTTSLHNLFLEAVNKFGVEKAVPKKILEYMNVPGLRRENVASHLQKYRIFLKRIQEATKSMQDGILHNWNDRPFRSSFVLNEITFLTNNLHQQYLDFLTHGHDDDINVCIPCIDHNNTTQKEYPFGIISPDLSSVHGIGDELRQLGIDIQFDQDNFSNDFELGYYGAQGDDVGTSFERLDPGIHTNNDDISFDCYFAQEDEFNQEQENGGYDDFTNPN